MHEIHNEEGAVFFSWIATSSSSSSGSGRPRGTGNWNNGTLAGRCCASADQPPLFLAPRHSPPRNALTFLGIFAHQAARCVLLRASCSTFGPSRLTTQRAHSVTVPLVVMLLPAPGSPTHSPACFLEALSFTHPPCYQLTARRPPIWVSQLVSLHIKLRTPAPHGSPSPSCISFGISRPAAAFIFATPLRSSQGLFRFLGNST